MMVLGIESTCDETAASVVESGTKILSNIISSQVNIHASFGGVVPEIACRSHIEMIIPTVDRALKEAKVSLNDIDLIAAAKGPGLIGALLIGLNAAKAFSFTANKPFIGVNHLEAHLYAAIMENFESFKLPALGIILSGGHTALLRVDNIGKYSLIGTTVDDAVGEAFDKVASLLDLPYPGGPHIENLAHSGDPYKYAFNAGRCRKNPLNFSYSGLKTNVLYAVKGQNGDKSKPSIISDSEKANIAASFQRAALSDIVNKTLLALDQFEYLSIIVGGGVCCNKTLRQMFNEACPNLDILWPPKTLSCDNAAMIAGLAYYQYNKTKLENSFDLKPMPRIPLLI